MRLRLLILLFAALLGGCGTMADPTTWWGDDDTGPQPAELLELTNQVAITELWSRDTGRGDEARTLGLVPHLVGERLYLADAGGAVSALASADGKLLWETKLDDQLTGGPGVGEGMVLVGNAEGEVIALDAENGEERWRSKLSSEVLSAPVADLGTVVARTGDGRVFGLDASGGAQRWRLDRDIPVLTLRGTGAPVLNKGRVLVGLEAGRLVSLELDRGQIIWETVVTVPSGRTELERVVDIDGAPLVLDRTVYVASYQGEVAALSESSGRLLWQRTMSSYNGIALDWQRVFVADDQGTLWALDADSGVPLWSQDALSWRGLSPPAVIRGMVVVGDNEGYVHFFDADKGTPVARTRVGDAPIVAAPQVRDGRLYVLGSEGDFAVLSPAAPEAR
jgi:outer membrane protein assembly factor BamB